MPVIEIAPVAVVIVEPLNKLTPCVNAVAEVPPVPTRVMLPLVVVSDELVVMSMPMPGVPVVVDLPVPVMVMLPAPVVIVPWSMKTPLSVGPTAVFVVKLPPLVLIVAAMARPES